MTLNVELLLLVNKSIDVWDLLVYLLETTNRVEKHVLKIIGNLLVKPISLLLELKVPWAKGVVLDLKGTFVDEEIYSSDLGVFLIVIKSIIKRDLIGILSIVRF